MWVAKIRFSSENTLIGKKAQEYSVDLFGFPLSFYYENEWVIVHIAGTIIGAERDKEEFTRSLKKEERVIALERTDDFIIGIIKEPKHAKDIYNKDVVHVSPAHISSQGHEILTVGSFDKSSLARMIHLFEQKYSGKMLSMQNRKLRSISVMRIHPDLTDKQKDAISLAIKNGYYKSPRETDVKTLARLSDLSFSTYQVHLRKAEEKLIPFYFE